MQSIVLNDADYQLIREEFLSFPYYDVIPLFSTYSTEVHYLDRNLVGLFVVHEGSRILFLTSHIRTNSYKVELDFSKVRYLSDSKYFYGYNDVSNSIDMSVVSWLTTGHSFEVQHQILNKFSSFYKDSYVSNIPECLLWDILSGHYDKFETTVAALDKSHGEQHTQYLRDLSVLDRNGLYSSDNCLKHPDYTFYNLTGRPNGSSLGYNYSAMEKSPEGRSWVVSRHGGDGVLVEFDFSSYHLYLISDIINYHKFKGQNVYEYFAKSYLGKSTLTEDEYKDIKTSVFKALYSDQEHEFHQYEFFQLLNFKKDELYREYREKSKLKSFKGNRELIVDNPSKGKVFNYYLQNYETQNSMEVLNKINNYLKDKKSKVILYTYDSFLFDVYKPEGKSLVHTLQSIFNFPTKVKYGLDYYNMS